MEEHASPVPSLGALPAAPGSTVLRPVIFAVDATKSSPGLPLDGDEPFDVRRTSLASSELTEDAAAAEEELCDALLAAMRGNPPGSAASGGDEELSVAASFASESAPFTPRDDPKEEAAPSPPPRRFASPFSRFSPGLRGGRWRQSLNSSPGAIDALDEGHHGASPHNALARDMEDDDHADTAGSDNISAALGSYAKDNPPVHFLSKRARVVSVSRRHAFPPSKYPAGKMDPIHGGSSMLGEQHSAHGNSWVSSYDIQSEGILPSGWLEKHARALPSAVVVVCQLNLSSEESQRAGRANARRAVEDLKATLAAKRSVPVHLACLVKEDSATGKEWAAAREKVCQECHLPQSQVFLLHYPEDLAPDAFGAGIVNSPYLAPHAQPQGGTPEVVMNPALRQLDRALRDASALYYSRLAEAQERKLALWRNRYRSANASFEVNTLLAAMRCARYAAKAGTLREFQLRTGGSVPGTVAGRWTDKESAAMRHYGEAYSWAAELHGRAVAWRSLSLSTSSAPSTGAVPSPAPHTPGAPTGVDAIASPKFSQSPGGGIGMELSLPGGEPPAPPTLAGATPPPPPLRRNSPALTSRKGYDAPENVAFFALLWEQSRAVASLLNAKLLRATDAAAAEGQWRRHRALFLAVPRGLPQYDPDENDPFFGPAWHRLLYETEERRTRACVAEGRWRRRASAAAAGEGAAPLQLSYHQSAAPWTAHGELSEAMLRLRRAVHRQMGEGDPAAGWLSGTDTAGRRRFVGSVVTGETGNVAWRFEGQRGRDHRGIALDYVLHALDLLDENAALCRADSGGAEASPAGDGPVPQPDASARLHYLAGRLLAGLDNPAGALVHLQIAAEQTKAWPSLCLPIQRAVFACEERRASEKVGDGSHPSDSRIRLLMRPETCALLSAEELADAQAKAWEESSSREVVWNHDDCSRTRAPFEFAVSFSKATHATSGDTVTACVSLKSCLGFQVCVESMQLVTTSGTFDVANIEQRIDETMSGSVSSSKHIPNRGLRFNSDDLAFFSTEITLPSDLTDVPLGGAAADASKFVPKSAKLSNMGLSHAAGNICESRFDVYAARRKISLNGKPVAIASVAEPSSAFLGGIPVTCHGIVLNLRQAGGANASSLTLRIERPRLASPLLRAGAPRLAMEECNYAAHAWARPAHHPWRLGPRVLRVLGPRPHMHATNLTEARTGGKAVEGTVNRIMWRLVAGGDEDCRDVRVRLKCSSVQGPVEAAAAEGGAAGVEPRQMPIFVQKAAVSAAQHVTENGVALPDGWEPRKDVGTDESHDATTTICPHLGAGKSFLFPLDVFRGVDPSLSSQPGSCSTTYEVVIMYRQVRAGKEAAAGDEVMVVQSGSIEWISPFAAEFSLSNGLKRPFPCGIQHPSNTTTQATYDSSNIVAADGEKVLMRCSLAAKELGSHAAARIVNVVNENETEQKKKNLFSSASRSFMQKATRGLRLSLSYSVDAQMDVEKGSGDETIPLGALSVAWEPNSLPPIDPLPTDTNATAMDDFGLIHGPLGLPNLPPVVFHGPPCQVLSAPFRAKLLNCRSAPRVGSPFDICYQVTNRTAKTQALQVTLNDEQDSAQLLGSGKLKEEVQMAPFEEKTFSFSFVSMVAGRVPRPPLTISSGRHQTWVINETLMSSREVFVMP
ncbi:hypothetical protein ACHAXT_008588 [Thalassiosira profunda]